VRQGGFDIFTEVGKRRLGADARAAGPRNSEVLVGSKNCPIRERHISAEDAKAGSYAIRDLSEDFDRWDTDSRGAAFRALKATIDPKPPRYRVQTFEVPEDRRLSRPTIAFKQDHVPATNYLAPYAVYQLVTPKKYVVSVRSNRIPAHVWTGGEVDRVASAQPRRLDRTDRNLDVA